MISFKYWALYALFLFLASCGGQAASPTAAPDSINLQMSWVHEYSSAMFYSAEKNGHFAANNLIVTLVEGGFQGGTFVNPIQTVLESENAIGLSDATSLILAQAAGKPVVAVATITQRSPSVIISLASSNIRAPQDLIGKRIAVAEGGATQLLRTMLALQNIAVDELTLVPRTDFGIDPLLNHDVDALMGWITNENVMLQEAGQESNILLLSDYGVDTYNSVVFTTEDMVQNKPDVVRRFVVALLAGTKDVIANPEQAVEYTLEYAPALDSAAQLRRLEAFIPLIQPPSTELGQMVPEIWAFTQQMLLDNALLGTPIPIEDVYRLDFVPSANG